jgi:8-oxo-dGTP diphosphatase
MHAGTKVHTCVGALMLRDGRVLLGRRSAHKTCAGCWDVPGGHVEPGETLAAALRRELKEELGIVPTACSFHSKHAESGVCLHLFVVTAWIGEPAPCGDEHSEIHWHELVSACRLSRLAAPGFVEIFRSLLGCGPRPVEKGNEG